jgi:hypothetical protein
VRHRKQPAAAWQQQQQQQRVLVLLLLLLMWQWSHIALQGYHLAPLNLLGHICLLLLLLLPLLLHLGCLPLLLPLLYNEEQCHLTGSACALANCNRAVASGASQTRRPAGPWQQRPWHLRQQQQQDQ